MDTMTEKQNKTVHILNPLAGKGTAKKVKDRIQGDEIIYMSDTPEETTEFIKKTCGEEPDTCFTVYGGDGTIFRAVNALMESGHNDTASLKIVPAGSGNDFVRTFDGKDGEFLVDVMRLNDKHAINVINMGFDCEVVKRASKLKKLPLISGKMSYIFGVVGELISKKPLHLKITVTLENGETEVLDGEYLLAAVANAMWYGGGFKVAPMADVSDGILNLSLVKNITRRKFISIVGDYKKGALADENGDPVDKVKDIMIYRRCTAVKIEGCGTVCADGEIFNENTVEISVIPRAIKYIKD